MAMIELNLPQFEFRTESGVLALHDGFVVTFFLPGHHQQNSHYVQIAIDLYLSLPGIAETLGTTDEEGYPLFMDFPGLQAIITEKLAPNHTETRLQVIDSAEGASSFSIRYYGLDSIKRAEMGWPNAVSGISFSFPTDFLGETGLLEIFTFSNQLATVLPFSFGYVSPAFVYDEGVGESAAFDMIYRLSRRYRCLDVPALLPDCLEIGSGPKGAYWGNYLSESLVKQLGGEDSIRNHFASYDVKLSVDENGSMCIYLNQVPAAGDVNRSENIIIYKAAFRLFADLILPRSVLYPGFNEEAMVEWLHRFEGERDLR